MSPSLPTTRPVWVWSLPAFAIILSFLWYRKKRGSLKTDSGGADETQDDHTSVESDDQNLENSEILGNGIANSENAVTEVTETIDQVKVVLSEASIRQKRDDFEKVADLLSEEENLEKETVKEIKGSVIVEKKERKESVIAENKEAKESVIAETKESVIGEKKEGKKSASAEEKETKELFLIEKKKRNNIIETTESVVAGKKETPIEKTETPSVKAKCGKKKKFKEMAKKSNESTSDNRQNKKESADSILEKKLAKLELSTQCSNSVIDSKQTNEDVAERDSANNSPSEVMLASPSVSGYSDTHSEGSSDSGKGCSEMLTPSRTPASGNSVSGDLPATSVYEFVIPQQLVGRLIGRHGSNVNEIKETTHASIYIKRHPDTPKLKICAVEGSQVDIESALEMIRRKFPKKRYPNVTLEQVVISPEPQMILIIPENMQLYLIEGINNDVILSSLVSAGHFFLQQPTHPTYLSLSRLNSCMMYCYSEPDQPTIPEGVGAGILCAAPVHNGWYRAQIISMDEENNTCDVKFVDYGGYMTMPVSSLRQIRVDFVNLPFQAAECYLAGVKPVNEDCTWSEEAKELVEKLTFGKVLQAQVYGYAEDSVPFIYLYTVVNDEVVLINEELVNRGYAEWLYSEPVTEEVEDVAGSEIEENAHVAVTV